MKKKYAIYLFDGVQKMADAIGVTRQSVYEWPDELKQKQSDLVIGAAFRLGLLDVEPQASLLRHNPEGEFRMIK